MNTYKNKLKLNIINNRYALIISFLIILSFPPWPVWGLSEWNTRLISIVSLIIALNVLTINNINRNFKLALLYIISVLYMSFGGVEGYKLFTHFEFTMVILILALSKDFLVQVLAKFEKTITILFIFGLIIHILGMVVKLPYFTIPPLNTLKTGDYQVRIFDLEVIDYGFGFESKFMSIFDEPGVVGTLLALLISYKKLEFKKLKDVVFIIAGLLSFSLAFYIILILNMIYNKSVNLKYFVLIIFLFSSFYAYKPEFMNRVLFDRFIIGEGVGIKIVDNRATEAFTDEYDKFINRGGEALIFGLGPNSLSKLSKNIELNASSYKTVVYQYGIVGALIFISFFFYATIRIAPVMRGYFFFIIFILLAWQRPGIFNYFNILLFLSGLSYISAHQNKLTNILLYKRKY